MPTSLLEFPLNLLGVNARRKENDKGRKARSSVIRGICPLPTGTSGFLSADVGCLRGPSVGARCCLAEEGRGLQAASPDIHPCVRKGAPTTSARLHASLPESATDFRRPSSVAGSCSSSCSPLRACAIENKVKKGDVDCDSVCACR